MTSYRLTNPQPSPRTVISRNTVQRRNICRINVMASMIITLRLGYSTLLLNAKWYKLALTGKKETRCKYCGDLMSLFHVTNECQETQQLKSQYLLHFKSFDNDITTHVNFNLKNSLTLRSILIFLTQAVKLLTTS